MNNIGSRWMLGNVTECVRKRYQGAGHREQRTSGREAESSTGLPRFPQKQPRAFDDGRRVPILGENDVLVDVCTPDRLDGYLAAPNAEVKRRADGSIRLVRLRSVGDDRGHQGECHGRSTITTERVRTDWGILVGSNINLKHKETCATWRNLPRAVDAVDRCRPNSARTKFRNCTEMLLRDASAGAHRKCF